MGTSPGDLRRIAQRFNQLMERAVDRAESAGYSPGGYRAMVRDAGSHVEAARRLLQAPARQVHSGLWHLSWLNMTDCSVEHLARLPEFDELFTAEERQCARERIGFVAREMASGRGLRPSDVPSRLSP